jgi:hypothetical protein
VRKDVRRFSKSPKADESDGIICEKDEEADNSIENDIVIELTKQAAEKSLFFGSKGGLTSRKTPLGPDNFSAGLNPDADRIKTMAVSISEDTLKDPVVGLRPGTTTPGIAQQRLDCDRLDRDEILPDKIYKKTLTEFSDQGKFFL